MNRKNNKKESRKSGMEAGGKRDGVGMDVGWKRGAGVNVVNTAVLTTLIRK